MVHHKKGEKYIQSSNTVKLPANLWHLGSSQITLKLPTTAIKLLILHILEVLLGYIDYTGLLAVTKTRLITDLLPPPLSTAGGKS